MICSFVVNTRSSLNSVLIIVIMNTYIHAVKPHTSFTNNSSEKKKKKKKIQTTLFTQTLNTTTKFVIMTICLSRNLRLCVTISHKLCKNIVFNTLKKHQWGDSNKYPKHTFYEEIRIKQYILHISLLIKHSVEHRIHFNGNVFWNKCCRCNEGSLYTLIDWYQRLITLQRNILESIWSTSGWIFVS